MSAGSRLCVVLLVSAVLWSPAYYAVGLVLGHLLAWPGLGFALSLSAMGLLLGWETGAMDEDGVLETTQTPRWWWLTLPVVAPIYWRVRGRR